MRRGKIPGEGVLLVRRPSPARNYNISNTSTEIDVDSRKRIENGTAALFRPSAPFFFLSLSLSLSFARSSTLDEVKVPTLKLAETRRRIRR